MTKWQLMQLLFQPMESPSVSIHFINGSGDDRGVYVQGISREDGSGSCFNVCVTIVKTGLRETIFVRTID